MKQESGQFRCTSILVASGRKDRVYRSLDDVPAEERAQLLKATNSPAAGTILIADAAGERYLQETIRERLSVPDSAPSSTAQSFPFWRSAAWRLTVEVAVLSGAGFLLWLLATLR